MVGDDFGFLLVYYDDSGKSWRFLFTSIVEPDLQMYIDKIPLMGRSIHRLTELLPQHGIHIEQAIGKFYDIENGDTGIFVEEETDEFVEGVWIGIPGSEDEILDRIHKNT